MTAMVAIVVHHGRIKRLLVEANEAVHVSRQNGDVVDPVSYRLHDAAPL
jgi:hypothetical protein